MCSPRLCVLSMVQPISCSDWSVQANLTLTCLYPLVLEYEEAAKRQADEIGLNLQSIDDIIAYLCDVARCHKIHYLWRPLLPDLKDDMILEVAVAGQCDFIVTYNQRHFPGVEQVGVTVIRPQELLQQIGELV